MWVRQDDNIVNLDLIYHIEKGAFPTHGNCLYQILLHSIAPEHGSSCDYVVFGWFDEKTRDDVFEFLYRRLGSQILPPIGTPQTKEES